MPSESCSMQLIRYQGRYQTTRVVRGQGHSQGGGGGGGGEEGAPLHT